MDFGKMPLTQLEAVDFSLPPHPESNERLLSGVPVTSPKIYVGCPRWGVKEWVGKLYPKGTKDAHFLDEYGKQFTCIELNSTFYNLYNEATISKWAAKAGGNDFKFCPKIYQGISHEGSLQDKAALTHQFEKSIKAFGKHLGPSFLQLSDRFGPQRKNELTHYLQALPADFFLFVEVRHADWFKGTEMEQLVALLQSVNKFLIITDTAGRRDVCHMHLAGEKLMLRFVANNLHPTDYTRVDEWVTQITHWIANGLKELYFIIHMDNEKHSPELAGYLIDKLNAALHLGLKKPVLLQQELF